MGARRDTEVIKRKSKCVTKVWAQLTLSTPFCECISNSEIFTRVKRMEIFTLLPSVYVFIFEFQARAIRARERLILTVCKSHSKYNLCRVCCEVKTK